MAGDMAYDNYSDSTVAHLTDQVNAQQIDVVIHVGECLKSSNYLRIACSLKSLGLLCVRACVCMVLSWQALCHLAAHVSLPCLCSQLGWLLFSSMRAFAGDISYADGYQLHWDMFMRKIEPIAAQVPYMVGQFIVLPSSSILDSVLVLLSDR